MKLLQKRAQNVQYNRAGKWALIPAAELTVGLNGHRLRVLELVCYVPLAKEIRWRHVAILVFMGGFDYECGFLLKETVFSSCGSSTTEMDE